MEEFLSDEYIPEVFLGHASDDWVDIAEPIKKGLDSLAVKVWYDKRYLGPGNMHVNKIGRALKNSMLVVSIISPKSISKPYPNYEIGAVLFSDIPHSKKRLIPVFYQIPNEQKLEAKKHLQALTYIEIETDSDISNAVTRIFGEVKEERARLAYKSTVNKKRILRIVIFLVFLGLSCLAYFFIRFYFGYKGELDLYTSNSNSFRYVGEIKKGKANGMGIATFKNGFKQEGLFKDNFRDGKFSILDQYDKTVGYETFKNDSAISCEDYPCTIMGFLGNYSGQINNSTIPSGKGRHVINGGYYIEGNFENYIVQTGNAYLPNTLWMNNQRAASTNYKGEVRNSEITGKGTLFFADGAFYTGFFENGRFHGEGTYVAPGTKPMKGNWEYGVYMDKINSKGFVDFIPSDEQKKRSSVNLYNRGVRAKSNLSNLPIPQNQGESPGLNTGDEPPCERNSGDICLTNKRSESVEVIFFIKKENTGQFIEISAMERYSIKWSDTITINRGEKRCIFDVEEGSVHFAVIMRHINNVTPATASVVVERCGTITVDIN